MTLLNSRTLVNYYSLKLVFILVFFSECFIFLCKEKSGVMSIILQCILEAI